MDYEVYTSTSSCEVTEEYYKWALYLIQPLGPHGKRVELLGEVMNGQAVVAFGRVVPDKYSAVDVDEGALAHDGGVSGAGGEELAVGGEREAAQDAVREAVHVPDMAVAEAAFATGEGAGRAGRRGQRGHRCQNLLRHLIAPPSLPHPS